MTKLSKERIEEIFQWHKAEALKTIPPAGQFDIAGAHVRDLKRGELLVRAVMVMLLDPKHHEYLEQNDPQALGQLRAAAEIWGEANPEYTSGTFRAE